MPPDFYRTLVTDILRSAGHASPQPPPPPLAPPAPIPAAFSLTLTIAGQVLQITSKPA